jgi:Uma2 family endonuclease
MGMPAQHTEWTAEMARALPDDGKRYEVLDGELYVSPSPSWRNQAVPHRLFLIIHPYVEVHGLGWTRMSPADIEFSPRRLVQPDLFVVPDDGAGEPAFWADVKRLLLAVEALSPTTARYDRQRKRPLYQDEGVPEFWILDIDSRLVERWRPRDERPEVITDILVWQPKPGIEPLRIELARVFGLEDD